ncbi:hypothetical protein TRFO_26246 [Tritrichomonas foetus]|uniref:Transcription factor TFIIIC triple barrel domain-containing protein n=1 Tax=Tritrichomonas foetus TaxID=1144522 RepID=A0A1J4K3D7_9EUKA|nr:hypothetical protein TRFO_26246 [Tritrichomonas foetus]|eukprot:OHT05887.1 hypothetical protein TRFO_26246 [Tritrichomonas foetus]
MEEEIITEETTIDVMGIIPAHLKDFNNIEIEKVSPSEIYLQIDGNRLKGKIGDTISTNLFFELNSDDEEANLIASVDKMANFEHVFYVPKDEFTKPFIPTDALKKPE